MNFTNLSLAEQVRISKIFEESNRLKKEYYNLHSNCPVCNSKRYSTTLASFTFDVSNPDKFKDMNDVVCKQCGWEGTGHELDNCEK